VRQDQVATTRLREAVDAFRAKQNDRLDDWARGLLARLANSSNAAKAFERLKLNRREEAEVLEACIEAEELVRTFAHRLKRAKKRLVDIERIENAYGELRKFVAHVIEQNSWPYAGMFSPVMEDNRATMVRGLDLIADRIEMERSIAKESFARFGATRKSHIKEAAENAAIWWLAEQIHGVFLSRNSPSALHLGNSRSKEKPKANSRPAMRVHRLEIADLAQVILGPDVSVERVRHAVFMREKRYYQMLMDRAHRRIPIMGKMIAALRRLKQT